MNLPIPKTRPGIIASIVLTIILFIFYYQNFYVKAANFYQNEYEVIDFYPNSNLPDLVAKLKVPKYTSEGIPGWVYGSIKNNGSLSYDLQASLNLQGEDIILYPSLFQGLFVFQREVSGTILPFSTVYFRLPLSNQILKSKDFLFYVNGYQFIPYTDPSQIKTKPLFALRRTIIENIFMPPWSNTLLPIMALLLCYLSENKGSRVDEKSPAEFKSLILTVFFAVILGVALYFVLDFVISESIGSLSLGIIIFVVWFFISPGHTNSAFVALSKLKLPMTLPRKSTLPPRDLPISGDEEKPLTVENKLDSVAGK